MFPINEGYNGENLYQITVGAVGSYVKDFAVYAYDEQTAINLVANHIVEEEYEYLYGDHYEVADLCEVGQTVSDYAEENNLTCAGDHGIYIKVVGIQLLKGEFEC